MSNSMFFGSIMGFSCVSDYPSSRGKIMQVGGIMLERQLLASDPIGTTTVTFEGIVPGVEIHVYLPDGVGGAAETEVAGVESCVANQQLTWPVYAGGSAYNNVFITLIKRGLGFRKMVYTSKLGNQSLPIFMVNDLGYSNPA